MPDFQKGLQAVRQLLLLSKTKTLLWNKNLFLKSRKAVPLTDIALKKQLGNEQFSDAGLLKIPFYFFNYPTKTEPPFTFNISPFICRARSDARKRIGPAISSAAAILLNGIFFNSSSNIFLFESAL